MDPLKYGYSLSVFRCDASEDRLLHIQTSELWLSRDHCVFSHHGVCAISCISIAREWSHWDATNRLEFSRCDACLYRSLRTHINAFSVSRAYALFTALWVYTNDCGLFLKESIHWATANRFTVFFGISAHLSLCKLTLICSRYWVSIDCLLFFVYILLIAFWFWGD